MLLLYLCGWLGSLAPAPSIESMADSSYPCAAHACGCTPLTCKPGEGCCCYPVKRSKQPSAKVSAEDELDLSAFFGCRGGNDPQRPNRVPALGMPPCTVSLVPPLAWLRPVREEPLEPKNRCIVPTVPPPRSRSVS